MRQLRVGSWPTDEEHDVKIDQDVVAALRRISLFRGLDDATLASIAQQTRASHFPAGTPVIDADASGRFGRLYCVVSGTAEARLDGETIATFGPGDSFGEMSVLDGRPRSADVVATTELHTLGLSSWNMRALLREEPEIAMSVITELVRRLRQMDEHDTVLVVERGMLEARALGRERLADVQTHA